MRWKVVIHPEFETEFKALSPKIQDSLASCAGYVVQFGPQAGRPWVDTLKGSKHAKMKELRFDTEDGVWRVAFAFDPERQAVLLVAGDKSGIGQRTLL